MKRDIDAIKVGKRVRKDYGDIDGLAASIADLGLLHPVVITKDDKLIAGARRLRACKKLGWTAIPVHVVDIDRILDGEIAENSVRKNLLPEERGAIALEALPAAKAAAKERQKAGGRRKGSGKLPEAGGEALDKLAQGLGVGRKTLEKDIALVEAAREDPARFGKMLADANRTGRSDGPYKRVKVAKQADAIRQEPPPLPNKGPYRVIVADPPWPYEVRKEDPSHRATHPYPQMSISEICALDVAVLAHKDCVLFLWTTNAHLRGAFTVLDSWGFEFKTMLTWAKDRMGTGDWLRGQTEHCLLAVKGKPTVVIGSWTTLFPGKMRANSQKPAEFYSFVESYAPAPRYASLFSRDARDGWDMHGDEVGTL